MSRSRKAAVVAVATGLVLSGGMASAAQKSVKDKHDDVESPSLDIQRTTVKNDRNRITIKVKMSRASVGRTHLVATLTPVTTAEGEVAPAPSGVYTVRSVVAEGKAKAKGKAKVDATLEYLATGATDVDSIECDGLRARITTGRRGNSRFRIPQVCFGEHAGTMKVEVMSVTADGDVVDEMPKPIKVKKGKKGKRA